MFHYQQYISSRKMQSGYNKDTIMQCYPVYSLTLLTDCYKVTVIKYEPTYTLLTDSNRDWYFYFRLIISIFKKK